MGRKSRFLHELCLLRVPKVGRNGYKTSAALGPGCEKKWLHHPCCLEVPEVGRNNYITLAVSGTPCGEKMEVATSP